MELEVSPRHVVVTPSSVAVLSGLGGSGGNSLLERLWGSVLVWGHYLGECTEYLRRVLCQRWRLFLFFWFT